MEKFKRKASEPLCHLFGHEMTKNKLKKSQILGFCLLILLIGSKDAISDFGHDYTKIEKYILNTLKGVFIILIIIFKLIDRKLSNKLINAEIKNTVRDSIEKPREPPSSPVDQPNIKDEFC